MDLRKWWTNEYNCIIYHYHWLYSLCRLISDFYRLLSIIGYYLQILMNRLILSMNIPTYILEPKLYLSPKYHLELILAITTPSFFYFCIKLWNLSMYCLLDSYILFNSTKSVWYLWSSFLSNYYTSTDLGTRI